ncbi:MAG: DUF424 family protein [Candidatus Woesearchaeota archaeon]
MEFIAKIHDGEKRVLALADENLYKKTFKEGKLKLEVNDFYYEDKISKEELLKLLKKGDIKIVNVVGNKAVDFLVEKNYISDFSKIDNIKYSFILFENRK